MRNAQRLARLERVREREPADLDELIERCLAVTGPADVDDVLARVAADCNVSDDAVRAIHRAVVRAREDTVR